MTKRPRVGNADRSRWQAAGSKIFSEPEWAKIGRSLKLSGRELQLVRGMFDDSTDFAIAENLGISPHTVRTHCKRSYRKLGVTDRAELILRVMREFLLLTATPDSTLRPICAKRAAGRCQLRNK
jgi:DNA-binding CsgD family transcriptional regulator